MKAASLAFLLLVGSLAAEEAKPAPPKPELGKPFVIDGIEITLSKVRLGTESGDAPLAKGALPTSQFYKVSYSLKNVTDNQIITVQDPWGKTRLKDEHGNFYRKENVDPNDYTKLRPGGESFGIIYLEVPLANAKDLSLIVDPGFYRDNGDGTLNEISKSSVTLKVPNPAAKP